MNVFLANRARRGETGQAMILFAVVLSVLMMIMGLAVEGGRVFAEYRHLQSAADMAALVGAQALPCTTTDANCATTAQTLACSYATTNGFSGCVSGGVSGSAANVPPRTCSPYDFVDYGNNSTNASCKTSLRSSSYNYIEVRLQDQLGTIPIFNVPVTLSAHAVAKHGMNFNGQYALISLDPNTPLSLSGSTTVVTTGSVFANGGVSGNNKGEIACYGGWYSANGSVSGVSTNSTGTPIFAPTGCTGSNDASAVTQSGVAQLSDPFANSSNPPTQPAGSSFTNCTECSQDGWWYDGAWHQGGTPSGNAELFPGIYNTLSPGNNQTFVLNPGVYTLTGGYSSNHGSLCLYGSPSCTDALGNCASASFSAGTIESDLWYYNCSPYGVWDSDSFVGTRPASLPTAAPTFFNSTTALNGVTFYIPSTASSTFSVHGNGGKGGGVYLAAPNPCPGAGTYVSVPPSVSYPAGSALGVYAYVVWGSGVGLARSPTSTAGTLYPSYDFSAAAECNSPLQVWDGEMLNPQHLHFLWYVQSSVAGTMNGASGQQMTGIVYAPNMALSVSGAGKGGGGPPWVDGQVIVKSATLTGNSYVDIAYRGCAGGSSVCSGGAGTQLMQ